MPEMGTSGLMSGDGKRGGAVAPVLAPILDSTGIFRRTSARMPAWQPERSLHGLNQALLPSCGHYLLGFGEQGFGLGQVFHGLLDFRIVHILRTVACLLVESAQVEFFADLL